MPDGRLIRFVMKSRIIFTLSVGLGAALIIMVTTILEKGFLAIGRSLFIDSLADSLGFFIVCYISYPIFLKEYQSNLQQRKPEEFRCLKCSSIIAKMDTRCPKCGWTWEQKGSN